jgi:hypothetical protein
MKPSVHELVKDSRMLSRWIMYQFINHTKRHTYDVWRHNSGVEGFSWHVIPVNVRNCFVQLLSSSVGKWLVGEVILKPTAIGTCSD